MASVQAVPIASTKKTISTIPNDDRNAAMAISPRRLLGFVAFWLALPAVAMAATASLVADLNTESQLGWLGVITGGVLVLAALLAPRTSTTL